jgi:NADPH-dependent 2,4-dienoyl-CoA reductase/sulfur reductase-like enzyme
MDGSFVIVGMGMAGLRAAETLRRGGHTGPIVAVAGEVHDPYDRPPLSKDLLAGNREPPDIVLRRDGTDDLELDWRRGVRATSLDVDGRVIGLDDGRDLRFDGLVIATGATPRALPPAVCDPVLAGVHVLRTLDDALALRAALEAGPARVCVIGAGFIGAEVAATCRGRGLDVTVLEALEQPMVRGLGVELGAVCAQLHRDHGVDLRLGVQVERVEGNGRAERVVLGDGSAIACDVVLVGIGVVPDTGWLSDSGLELDNGVVCDASCLAADGVVACGDLARWPNPLFDGELMRLEHWTNATEQAVHAAERLQSGVANEFAPVPFVWSDQYDCKIQSVGRFDARDRAEIVHGDLGSRKFVAVFERGGRVTGALGFNQPRHVMRYRALIARRATFDEAMAYARG